MSKLTIRPSFFKDLDALKRTARKQYKQAAEILLELQRELEPTSPLRSETRIKNCVKFELTDGYRMVFQKAKEGGALIALTVGSHDHVDTFLDGHKGWIFDQATGKMKELRLATVEETTVNVVASIDVVPDPSVSAVVAPKALVFAQFTDEMLENIGVPKPMFSALRSISDANSMDCMQALNAVEDSSQEAAGLLLAFATGNLDTRESVLRVAGKTSHYRAHIAAGDLEAIYGSTDEFLTFDDPADLRQLLERGTFEQWQLFLHPDQQSLVEREFGGPARIRGISGSGKTVVALHRARHLAKQCRSEKEKVLLTTYDKGLANAASRLLDALCGPERSAIEVTHLHGWCLDYLTFCDQPRPRFSPDAYREVKVETLNSLGSAARDTLKDIAPEYCWDEVEFLMGRFLHEDRADYLTTDRAGRGRALSPAQRQAILDLYTSFHRKLFERGFVAPAEFVRMAYRQAASGRVPEANYVAVIVDEVQDISELGLKLLYTLCGSRPNGLMLVGDNTQRIFTRGYSLRDLGIDIAGRGVILRKNYRNTRQILTAAFPLVAEEWNTDLRTSGVDPTTAGPEFSVRDGTRPYIVKCEHEDQEGRFLASEIIGLLRYKHYVPSEICVLARNKHYRQLALHALQSAGVDAYAFERTESGEVTSHRNAVRVSSLHGAKGHEFAAVFIVGCVDGVIPFLSRSNEDSLTEESAVLYVGMTRARDIVYLSHSQFSQRGQRQARSSLLDRIAPNCDACEFRR